MIAIYAHTKASLNPVKQKGHLDLCDWRGCQVLWPAHAACLSPYPPHPCPLVCLTFERGKQLLTSQPNHMLSVTPGPKGKEAASSCATRLRTVVMVVAAVPYMHEGISLTSLSSPLHLLSLGPTPSQQQFYICTWRLCVHTRVCVHGCWLQQALTTNQPWLHFWIIFRHSFIFRLHPITLLPQIFIGLKMYTLLEWKIIPNN